MVEGWQLSFPHALNNALDTVWGRDIGLCECYALGCSDGSNQLVGAGLVSYYGNDISASVEGSPDSRYANVASGPDYQNGFHDHCW
jgi:hypothetical protein